MSLTIIVEREATIQSLPGIRYGVINMQVDPFVFNRPPESRDKHIVSARPLPSMLILMPLSFIRPVNAADVN